MKFLSVLRSFRLVSGLTVFLTIFILRPVFSQETAKNESKSTIKLKIVNEKNGKTTVFDTTFNSTVPIDQNEINAIVKDMDIDMKELAEDMKELRVNMDIEMPDSLVPDSVHKLIDKVITMGLGKKCREMKMKLGTCGHFDQFEFPCMPECPMPPEELEDLGWNEWTPGPDPQVRRYFNRRESLSDMIGDIPLDKVKSYSIKDRKGGKRIIIDIDDFPMFEKQDKIFYMGKPNSGARYRHFQKTPKDVRVIIKTDKDNPE
ncbi:MAG: hypothetical protein M0Q38_10640 [Bacteroidales bacterium]|jgi:hypothetical protein|nr:hypothetical protein [Bacteroidales bacterium]